MYYSIDQDTTVIPNFYSIRDELKREMRFSQSDLVNNNLISPDGPQAKTPLSPTHITRYGYSGGWSDRHRPPTYLSSREPSYNNGFVLRSEKDRVSYATSQMDMNVGREIVSVTDHCRLHEGRQSSRHRHPN